MKNQELKWIILKLIKQYNTSVGVHTSIQYNMYRTNTCCKIRLNEKLRNNNVCMYVCMYVANNNRMFFLNKILSFCS